MVVGVEDQHVFVGHLSKWIFRVDDRLEMLGVLCRLSLFKANEPVNFILRVDVVEVIQRRSAARLLFLWIVVIAVLPSYQRVMLHDTISKGTRLVLDLGGRLVSKSLAKRALVVLNLVVQSCI